MNLLYFCGVSVSSPIGLLLDGFRKGCIILLATLILVGSAWSAKADSSVVGFWQFEGKADGFLKDSGSNGLNLRVAKFAQSPAEPQQKELSESGPGSSFASIQNKEAASFTQTDLSGLTVEYSQALSLSQFTIEAFVNLNKGRDDDKNSTLASMGSPGPDGAAWMLVVAGNKSPRGARSLIFIQQFASGPWAKESILVVNSEIQLAENTDYYVAVSFDASNTADEGLIFYVKDLTNKKPLVVVRKSRPKETASLNVADTPFWIGNNKSFLQSQWDGLIDEVRLSNRQLAPSELLVSKLQR